MLKYVSVTLVLLFAACKQSATQPLSDRLVMGIKAPVKQYTTTMYRYVVKDADKWVFQDTTAFQNSYTCYFNPDGNVDSIILRYKKPFYNDSNTLKDSTMIQKSVAQVKDGKRTGKLVYEGSVLKERQEIFNNGKDSVITKAFSPAGNYLSYYLTVLGNNQCPEINIFIEYDSLGNEKYKKTQHWKRDENCGVISVEETDNNGTKTYDYVVLKSDIKHNFPLETHVIPQGGDKPEKMYIRTVEYY